MLIFLSFELNLDYIVTEWCLLSVENLFFPIITENETDEKKKEDNIVLIENRKKIWESMSSKDILKQATQGLVFLHSFNFVHRNLKPSNVLIAQTRNFRSDFRIAKNLQDKKEQEYSGERLGGKGSDGWMPPISKIMEKKLNRILQKTFSFSVVSTITCSTHNIGILLEMTVHREKRIFSKKITKCMALIGTTGFLQIKRNQKVKPSQ